MEGASFDDEADSSDAINSGNLKAMVLHDSEAPLEQKETLLPALKAEFGRRMAFDFTWWKIEHLRSVPVSFLAGQAAGKSDLIIFHVHFPENLPEYTESWLRHCLRMHHPHKPIVLLSLPETSKQEIEIAGFVRRARRLTEEFGIKFAWLSGKEIERAHSPASPPSMKETSTARDQRVATH